MQRYLIDIEDETPFFSEWFEPENHFINGMKVFDLAHGIYTTDGKNWLEIEVDNL